ncbi:NuoI/complex I 23 kDa subunit family protein [Calderihabitans maritimus]|uniref:NADH-quinone oxidoreductase subunit I n=1 Tax=Calderihabitans maritimus TaxID=1246530 RepID=A0A1Z5HXY9_9FIRM|nr:NADH-quinone oxidoreductase subunit I [Calderihabitans maritimus]GAW94175.1 NADH-quinone oxidoreductase subunit I [Calderihabitans maritimus]
MALRLRDVVLAKELIRGLGVTLRHLFQKPVTLQYPTERREPHERFRGLVRWDREKCAACVLCEHYCPVKAIDIVTGEGEQGEKVVLHYQIDASHCMLCGFCVEICPVNALSHSPYYELAVYDLEDTIYAQEKMAGEPPITRYR